MGFCSEAKPCGVSLELPGAICALRNCITIERLSLEPRRVGDVGGSRAQQGMTRCSHRNRSSSAGKKQTSPASLTTHVDGS